MIFGFIINEWLAFKQYTSFFFSYFLHLNTTALLQFSSHFFFPISEMTSIDDSPSISSTPVCSQASIDALDDLPNLPKGEQLRKIIYNNEESDQDEPQLDNDDDDEKLTSVLPTTKVIPIVDKVISVKFVFYNPEFIL
jgi:hypothetical protein